MSTHSDSLSSAPSSRSSSPSQMIHPDQMMDWKEWEGLMRKIQSRGLTRFLNRYVVTKKTDINKFLVNLELTISILINEQSSSDDETQNLNKIQALVRLENSLLKFLRTRKKLPEYNSIDDAVSLIQRAENILILTGAGISTSCGIPDFRSENGLYSQLQDYEGLDDPHDMFDLQFFKSNPSPFYKFLKTIFPFSSTNNINNNSSSGSGSNTNGASTRSTSSPSAKPIIPSDSHRFIKLVESNSKLLRNYTQNIDTLEMRAGVKNLIQCHGSFAKFTCLKCRAKYPASEFEESIARGQVILCPKCSNPETVEASKPNSNKRRKLDSHKFDAASSDGADDDDGPDIDWVKLGLMKPDIIFFGEGLPEEFDEAIERDRLKCDLVIVIGTSLKVAPVSEIIKYVPTDVPQILINRDPIYHGRRKNYPTPGEGRFEYEGDEFEFDICLFGQSDLILRELSRRLGPAWQLDNLTSPPEPSSHPDGCPSDQLSSQSDDPLASNGKQTCQFAPFGQHINHIWLFPGANVKHSWFDRWRILEQTAGNPSSDPQELSSSDESDLDAAPEEVHRSAHDQDREKDLGCRTERATEEPSACPIKNPDNGDEHPSTDSPPRFEQQIGHVAQADLTAQNKAPTGPGHDDIDPK
ncbi:NAD-dependent histone deacetylase sir2 [Puccinia graminis f. sp. tritici]|uniref:NAD-dependent histone deacetylase sir2 n=1 Tax=Puccinia graminis f. sp. tritici TaxID=56615 RepID=A0A5B0PWI7_PUCGR|nr:NAD-dependent histone deacetylase sir2 [Puccinia graminis f. sp. tritici]